MKNLQTILLVEDDKLLRQTLRENLENEDFIILEASKGQRCIDILQHHTVNLVLLDLNLPDSKGLEYISAIREVTNVPLIMVSGENDDNKKIGSINAGADDFMSKPVHIGMLIAKINAHLRRYKTAKPAQDDAVTKSPCIAFDQWVLDTEKFQLFDSQKNSAELTIREYRIIKLLIENAGCALPRQDLCEAIKEKNYIPSARSIDVKITRIRKKIRDHAATPNIIKTVRGVGYMFNKDKII